VGFENKQQTTGKGLSRRNFKNFKNEMKRKTRQIDKVSSLLERPEKHSDVKEKG
jgi:hypothetical protein